MTGGAGTAEAVVAGGARPALRPFTRRVVLPVSLAVVTVVLFLPTFGYEHVNYDDPKFVFDNPFVNRGLTPAGVRWAFAIHGPSQYHPLTWLSHMLDYELFGSRAGGHHAVNVLVHACAVVLLYGLLLDTTGLAWRSAVVAALFAWHPTRVESVAWISERKDLLCGLFVIATVWAYARYVRSPSWRRYTAVLILYALALASKPMAVTLPVLLMLFDYWPLARPRRGLGAVVVDKLPLLAMAIASAVLSFLCQLDVRTVVALSEFPMSARLANAVVSYARYLRMAVLPVDLAVLYPRQPWPPTVVIACLLLLCAITAAVIYARRAYATFGWGWFVLALGPVIGVLQVGSQAMADRYTYLPYVGLFVAVVWAAGDALKRRHRAARAGAVLTAAILTVFAAGTVALLTHWRDSVTLFAHALDVTRNNPIAHNNLGTALHDRGQFAEAAQHHARAVALAPRYVEARLNLGIALQELGDPAAAERQFRAALEIDPGDRLARFSLANAAAKQGRHGEAKAMYEQLLSENGNDVATLINLGATLEALGDRAAAVERYRAATQLDPNDPDAVANLQRLSAGG